MEFCACGAAWMKYKSGVMQTADTHIACISSAHRHAPLPYQTSHTKHKFKDIIKNCRLQQQSIKPWVSDIWVQALCDCLPWKSALVLSARTVGMDSSRSISVTWILERLQPIYLALHLWCNLTIRICHPIYTFFSVAKSNVFTQKLNFSL